MTPLPALPALPSLPDIDRVVHIARLASELILQIYSTPFEVRSKADTSPVTEADERAEALILPLLHALTPGLAVVGEEAFSRGDVPILGRRFWLVDALDGTREFVSRNGEFTVNIALVEDGQPVLGVVDVPVQKRLFAGLVGQGAWVFEGGTSGPGRAIQCRRVPAGGATLASSRSHSDEARLTTWLAGPDAGGPVAARISAGSSLKFGLIAVGLADVYPRFGPTMEWDTAAGHAVLLAAGGSVNDLAGRPLRYGKAGFHNPHFVARGAGWPPAAGAGGS
jgi:3'(2'), 5'-bisphosphate nucleotidase